MQQSRPAPWRLKLVRPQSRFGKRAKSVDGFGDEDVDFAPAAISEPNDWQVIHCRYVVLLAAVPCVLYSLAALHFVCESRNK